MQDFFSFYIMDKLEVDTSPTYWQAEIAGARAELPFWVLKKEKKQLYTDAIRGPAPKQKTNIMNNKDY